MKKCLDEKLGNIAWRICLIKYLCIPISHSLLSPAEILNKRVYKGYQPFLCDNHTLNCRSGTTIDKPIERKKNEKFYRDSSKSVSDKPIIPEGQNIWYRNHIKNIWEKGTIIDRDDTSGKSYTLVWENGKILSHNHIDWKIRHTNVLHKNLEAKLSPPIPSIQNVVIFATPSSTNAKVGKGKAGKSVKPTVIITRSGHTVRWPEYFVY